MKTINNENYKTSKKVKKHKVKKKKHKYRKFLLFLLVIVFLYLYNKNNYFNFINNNFNPNKYNSTSRNISEYKVIKQDINENYDGIGQQKIKNKDGYFTTFTTNDNHKKTYIEYKQNGNSSWSNNEYWGGTMEDNGCGITVMSIILSGYNKNYTPEVLRKKYFPVIDYNKLSKELSINYGIKNSDFYYDSIHLSQNCIIEHLKTNRPIIICVWNKPNDNRWTTSSHYMALLACDDSNMVYISNSNGLENDSKSSGWYNISQVTPYIAKALYIESYN